MRTKLVLTAVLVFSGFMGWRMWQSRNVAAARAVALPMVYQAMPDGGQMAATMVGHEFREDDLPAIAKAPDGSLWVAWLSFVGDRDDVAIRHYQDGKWSNIHWVPNTSGDSWLPQIAVDASNCPIVVWSQQVIEKGVGNWDLYSRRFDPAKQEWGKLDRLTTNPLPDINPRMASNGKGQFGLVWQSFRGKNSNIFYKSYDGQKWSPEVRVTHRAANDWEPAVAMDSKGTAWIAYDSYKNGNYDVFLSKVSGGDLSGPEIPVAATPLFEAKATVTVDTSDRVWVAYEQGEPNWGKDQGYIIRDRKPGVPLGGTREVKIRCYQGGQWKQPESMPEFPGKNAYIPHVFSDGRGSVWMAANVLLSGGAQTAAPAAAKAKAKGKGRAKAKADSRSTYWQYWVTHFDGKQWSQAVALPNSKGRSSTRINATLANDGSLWLAWPTDGRVEGFYHRPLRQAVYAGSLPAPRGENIVSELPAAKAPEAIEVKAGHKDERADVAAIRAYAVPIAGTPNHIVRGDFHRHTELSWDGGGTTDGSLQDFYRYMIDCASMDFGASTDHQGGEWPYWWWYTQKMTDMYHVPGAYVPIFGYERSAQYPFGHHNVFFAKRSESRVTPFFLKEGAKAYSVPVTAQGDEPGVGTGDLVANDTALLYEEIRQRNGLTISHTSGTRMGTDWNQAYDPKLEPVVEIFQGCRTSYEKLGAPYVVEEVKDSAHIKQAGYEPKGMVSNAWAKGYLLGVEASSDHNSTHISYTLVYTSDPTRQGVLNAIRKRHTYGATDNIIMDVRMGEHFMGDEFALAQAAPLHVKARGTRAVAKVDVIKDNNVIYSTAPKKQNVDFEFTDKGSVKGRHFYYIRLMQDDGMIAWTSPMFINYK
jgi:hypothetical protein